MKDVLTPETNRLHRNHFHLDSGVGFQCDARSIIKVKKLDNLFTKEALKMFSKECKLHLEQAKMSRFQHFKHANQISWRLFGASFAAFIHSFAPRYFKTSATDTCIAIARENNKI